MPFKTDAVTDLLGQSTKRNRLNTKTAECDPQNTQLTNTTRPQETVDRLHSSPVSMLQTTKHPDIMSLQYLSANNPPAPNQNPDIQGMLDYLVPCQAPTFYQKQAIMANLKRKWKEEHGMVSLFDKRQIYKEKNERVKSAANCFKERQMLKSRGTQSQLSR